MDFLVEVHLSSWNMWNYYSTYAANSLPKLSKRVKFLREATIWIGPCRIRPGTSTHCIRGIGCTTGWSVRRSGLTTSALQLTKRKWMFVQSMIKSYWTLWFRLCAYLLKSASYLRWSLTLYATSIVIWPTYCFTMRILSLASIFWCQQKHT